MKISVFPSFVGNSVVKLGLVRSSGSNFMFSVWIGLFSPKLAVIHDCPKKTEHKPSPQMNQMVCLIREYFLSLPLIPGKILINVPLKITAINAMCNVLSEFENKFCKTGDIGLS
jgi:hypothetical protein